MRRNYIAAAVAALLVSASLGGCASDPLTMQPTVDTAQIQQIIGEVQNTAATICGFVPTINTVAAVLGNLTGAGPAVGLAAQIAQSICSAVMPAKASLHAMGRRTITRRTFGASAPNVSGVPIEGYFIR